MQSSTIGVVSMMRLIGAFLLFGNVAAHAEGTSLQDLQRKLDDAKKQGQKPAQPAEKRPQPVLPTLVVRTDKACRLKIDGNDVATLVPAQTKSFHMQKGDAIVECVSTSDPGIKHSSVIRFEPDSKVVLQIELDKRPLARQSEASSSPAVTASAPPAAITSAPPVTEVRPTPPRDAAPGRNASRETQKTVQAEEASATAPAFSGDGRLSLVDVYKKTTVVDVHTTVLPDGTRRMTSGDSVSSDGRMLSVRLGSHVGVLTKGSLWKFPLVAGSSGEAILTFDGGAVPGHIKWRIRSADATRQQLDGDVEIPADSSILSGSQLKLRGTWKAEFGSTFPIPLSATLDVRPNATGFGSGERSRSSWEASR